MPIIRIKGRPIFFAHVLKCAGTSIEKYLRARFGPLALLDRDYYDHPSRLRWSATSLQHIDVANLRRLFHMEEGLDAVIGWFETHAGNTESPRDLGRHMTAEARVGRRQSSTWIGLPHRHLTKPRADLFMSSSPRITPVSVMAGTIPSGATGRTISPKP
ncbi:MAG: hypothetical protein AAFO17_15100 [Pseudomonadota bacterium]